MQDPEKDQSQLCRHSSPERSPIGFAEIEMCIELPPRLSLCPHIKNPSGLAQVFEIPSAHSDDNVEDARDQEEVGGENELVMEEMGNDAEKDR